ncbi:DUF354 domain-containing protein [bacterium]|nr:DUF354 domain-containing protein [bacterium]
MHYLFHLGHPAHFHLFKNPIAHLKSRGHRISVLIKKKDILEDLMQRSGIEYVNILQEGRKDTKVGLLIGMIKRDWRLFWYCVKHKPNLLIGTSVEIGHVGTILGIPSINVNEDDAAVVPLYAKLSYPWCSHILSPVVCDNGKWERKSIKYEGYHELAYLHPDNFTPSIEKVKQYNIATDKPFFLIRFAKLTAHHDEGIQGINDKLALEIINILKPNGQIYITSERELSPEFEPYRLAIDPLDIHHVMSFSSLYIGDSQTMAAEAGVLGVPFIRFNDFVGRISYLAELENKYKLGFGIKSNQPQKLLDKAKELVQTDNLESVFSKRRKKMLSEKIDVADFLTWFIADYPKAMTTKYSAFIKK